MHKGFKVSRMFTMLRDGCSVAELESILSPDSIDDIFRSTATMQTQRQLLFSSIVHLMCLVVCPIKPSVNASYVHLKESFSVSVKSVYNKIYKVEPEVSRELVFRTAEKVKEVIDELGVHMDSPIPGYQAVATRR